MRHVLVVATLVVGGMVATQGAALAGPPDGPAFGLNGEFLCPAVGNATAAAHNGQGWLGPIGPDAEAENFTFLPGNNQAGANANSKALNTLNPGDSPGPGDGNSDWSPIWPGNNPDPG
jgi:opacity protein-like surface antigen